MPAATTAPAACSWGSRGWRTMWTARRSRCSPKPRPDSGCPRPPATTRRRARVPAASGRGCSPSARDWRGRWWGSATRRRPRTPRRGRRACRRSIHGSGCARRGSRATRRRRSGCSRTCRPRWRERPARRGPRPCLPRGIRPPRSRRWPRSVAHWTWRAWRERWATRVARATPCTRSWRGRPSRTTAPRRSVWRALRQGDSSAATLVLEGELLAGAGRYRDAERAYRAAARDSSLGALAIYRRARILARLGDAGAPQALSGFAQSFPADTAAPTALYVLGDMLADRGEWAAAARWFDELIARYPADLRASLARFRLAAQALRDSLRDRASALFRAEVAAGGPQRTSARFWLGKLALLSGDTAAARASWLTLAREDSIGYYGLRARREVNLPPLRFASAPVPAPSAPIAAALGRIDTLLLAGLDTAAQAEVRTVLGRAPQQDLDALLAWSDGLARRGFGPAAVRLGWQAALKAPNDPRVLRAIFPWPNRRAVEGEAAEFGVDPLLLVAIVRQESVFDAEALSPAGARGLAQLLPGTAALTARGLDVTFYPDWITVPDLNLHLGAAHLQELLRRFDGRVDVAVAAYNAGVSPAVRWLGRPGADDPDQFLESIPYQETRGYVRSVLRNRELYRALYVVPTN